MTTGQSQQNSALYFRQLLVGRDIARDDPLASSMANYIYLLGDQDTHQAVIVDPAYVPSDLMEVVAIDEMTLVGAIATHYHADHIGGELAGYAIAGISALLELVDVPLHVQRSEVEWVRAGTHVSESSLIVHDAGDVIDLGQHQLALVHTPGHTPGSQCILVDDVLITGDTLFIDGCGRTDLPGGDAEALYESLQHRLAQLPDNVRVYPGHAYSPLPSATLAEVQRTNTVLAPQAKREWLARFS